jgi:hypothetical protein
VTAREGDRIELILMGDDPDPLPPGATGIVEMTPVDYQGSVQLSVKWDAPHERRGLALVSPPDVYRVIERADG